MESYKLAFQRMREGVLYFVGTIHLLGFLYWCMVTEKHSRCCYCCCCCLLFICLFRVFVLNCLFRVVVVFLGGCLFVCLFILFFVFFIWGFWGVVYLIAVFCVGFLLCVCVGGGFQD